MYADISGFRNAVKRKYISRISEMLKKQNVLQTDKYGDTFLHIVAEYGEVETAKELLALGSNPHHRNINGKTPIFNAIKNSIEMVKTLLDDKTILDANLIRHALYFGNDEIVRLLLQNTKFVPEFPNSSHDKISTGCENHVSNFLNDLENTENLMKVLLYDEKYSLSEEKNYPLLIFFAAKIGGKNILQLVLNSYSECLAKKMTRTEEMTDHRKELNVCSWKSDETALHYAVSQQHVDAVRFLLEQGADPNCKSVVNFTPLHYAARLENYAICQLLLDFGANANPNEDGKINPLHLVCGYLLGRIFHGFDEFTTEVFTQCKSKFIYNQNIMRLLLKRGANPDRRAGKLPPLIHACQGRRHLDEMKILLECGGNVRVADDNGNTALHHAAKLFLTEIVDFLLEKGLEVDVKNKSGYTPLMLVVKDGSFPQMIKLLVDRGASLTDATEDESIFHIAMLCGRSKVVLTLLELGVDIKVKRNSDSKNSPITRNYCEFSNFGPERLQHYNSRKTFMSYIAMKGDSLSDYSLCCFNPDNMKEEVVFFDEAKLELEELKSRKILKDVGYSYYDFLARDIPTAIRIFKNPRMKEELLNVKNYQNFLHYKDLLEHRYNLVKDLEKCFDKVFNFLLSYGKIRLTINVIEMILGYFSARDFQLFSKILTQVKY